MKKVWTDNVLPHKWNLTIQIPLCRVGYKYYAYYILQELQKRIVNLSKCQMVFIKNNVYG